MACAIISCKSHRGLKQSYDEEISFHRFPKNEELRNEWIRRIGRWNWQCKTHTLCSKHFTIDSFKPNKKYKYRRLKADALPSLHLPDTVSLEPLSCKCKTDGCSTSTISRWQQEKENIKNLSQRCHQRISTLTKNKSLSDRKREAKTCAGHACNQHEKTIKILQQELERVKKKSQQRLRKINTLTKRLSRLEERKRDLHSIIMDRLKQDNIETEYLMIMENMKKNEIIKRFLIKQGGDTLTKDFNNEIKKIAVTLHYLSPKAYTFIRDQFQDVLPHPKTISTWYKGVDCNPGFTTESFDALKIRVQQNGDKTLFCTLAVDEIAIRKLIEWDGHNQNYYGFANFGCDLDSDSVPIATQALTFMVTCLNDTWKIPVGYFLIKSINSEQKATLVHQCIHLLQECISVVSVTFDGAASNIAMSNRLGCDFSVDSVSFQCGESEVCLWPDPSHNIKLVRNAFAEKTTLLDCDNNIISWNFIEKLVKLQEDEGLHLGNKLRRGHIKFIKQKMKVRFATQLFSNSVADALQYCKEKSIPGFENCEGTITFIRVFNNLFDIFNSRNMRAKGWKKALAPFNIEETKIFFEAADSYIRNLKLTDGTYVIDSNRKTGFNGFLVCMKSLIKIYNNTVGNNKLQYLCTYKMSQDQIELFFGAIRAKCGFNNNPSARTFQAAYKRLLVHAQFKDSSSGNCIPLEKISILNYQPKNPVDAINKSSGNVCLLTDSEISESETLSFSHVDLDHDYLPCPTALSEYSSDVVHYMAGFVVRKLEKSLRCEACIEALCNCENDLKKRVSLMSIKDRGGLVVPSKDVVKICQVTERMVRQQKNKVRGELLGRHKHIMFIINKVCGSFVQTNIFNSLIFHSLEQTYEDNHRTLLIKAICKCYLKARIHHIIKETCVPHEKIRSFLTKTILFKGQ